jgi:hypothetical protein
VGWRAARLQPQITAQADRVGAARKAFEALNRGPLAADAAADAEQARAEMDAQAEAYLLKRSQVVILRWAMERYRSAARIPC